MELKRNDSRRDILLYACMVLFCVVLLIQIIVFAGNLLDYQKVYTVDEATLINMVTTQEYDSLVNNVHRNEAIGVPVKGSMAELYAVAHYYEAAMLYHAHRSAGNEEQAQKKYAQMLEYEQELGTYAFVKEEIWEFLGINREILK